MNKPLRIGLVMQGDRGWMGGIQYINNIVLALASLPSEVRATFELCLLTNKSIDPNLYSQIEPYLNNIYYQEVDLEPLTFVNRLRWKILRILFNQGDSRFRRFVQKQKIDFVYPYFDKNIGKKSYRSAAWIPDFQHKYLPEFFTSQEIEHRDRSFAEIASYSPTVVLSSKIAESDFQKFFPEVAEKSEVLSFKTSTVSTWYKGDPQNVQQKYSLGDRFFLISNQFWQHKNHLVIFKALKLLQEKSIYPVVVCTGHIYDYRQPEYSDVILQTIHHLGIAKQVYLLGMIPRFDQIQLMRRSLAVIQPSLFEGWSTVVEDARCLGKPMILADLAVNIEQNPPNSLFFERNSLQSLATLLADWWERLLPGADPEQEAIARENNLAQVQAFGDRFLEIVKKEVS